MERVWGRRDLPAGFGDCSGEAPIGEVWYEDGEDAALLVKYLFTSERLSIQVHPDDAAARARGLARGKDEAWLVIDAEPGAVIGLGLKHAVPAEALREAALDGSLETLIDWRPARVGDFYYSPGGTVHAIGAGLSLVEIQQNLDLTYRLYDYGRPRELHLDDAVAVADPAPFESGMTPFEAGPGRRVLACGGAFTVERWSLEGTSRIHDSSEGALLIPLTAQGRLDGRALEAGSVWRIEGGAVLEGGDLIAAYPGSAVRDLLGAEGIRFAAPPR